MEMGPLQEHRERAVNQSWRFSWTLCHLSQSSQVGHSIDEILVKADLSEEDVHLALEQIIYMPVKILKGSY